MIIILSFKKIYMGYINTQSARIFHSFSFLVISIKKREYIIIKARVYIFVAQKAHN